MNSNKNTNIMVLVSSLSRKAGGLFFTVPLISKEMNFKVTVFGLKDEYTELDKYQWNNVDTNSYDVLGPKGFGFSNQLKNNVINFKASLVHLHGLWMYPQYLSLKWQKLFDRPVIISPHGMLDLWAIKNSSLKKKFASFFFVNRSLKNASCLHALCIPEYNSIRNYGLSNPVAIIPNGVDVPTYKLKKYTKNDERILLYLGRIHPKKGLVLLIEALYDLKSKGDSFINNWKLQIAGWDQGGHSNTLKNLIKKYNLSEHVDFLGPVYKEDKLKLFNNADAFILPSYSEGLPISVLEAWSYQLPVLMTNECNLNEGFEAEAAIKIDLCSLDIAKKLSFLNNMSKTDIENLSYSALNLIKEKFSWPKISKDMEMTYKWLLDKSRKKPKFIKIN